MTAADGEIYRKYSDDLVRFATGLVGPSSASDVVSEAVLRCISSTGWKSVNNTRAYLYRAVLNEASRHHRTANRRRARERRAAPSEIMEPPELRPEVLVALRDLSVRQRAVIFLTYWEDLTATEVASVLGIGEGSVKRHLARARIRLKEILDGLT